MSERMRALVAHVRQRVLAWTPNSIQKTGLKDTFAEDMEDQIKSSLKGKVPKKVGQKGKVSVFVVGQSITLAHQEECFPIGTLLTEHYGSRKFPAVNYSYVVPAYQGAGLGRLMYDTAIQEWGGLYGSADLSVGSSAAWKYLVDKYRGSYVIPSGWSPTKKEILVSIVGWEVVKGITYPVFQMPDGKKKGLQQLVRSRDASASAAKYGYYMVQK